MRVRTTGERSGRKNESISSQVKLRQMATRGTPKWSLLQTPTVYKMIWDVEARTISSSFESKEDANQNVREFAMDPLSDSKRAMDRIEQGGQSN
jgi:hypothetical protein